MMSRMSARDGMPGAEAEQASREKFAVADGGGAGSGGDRVVERSSGLSSTYWMTTWTLRSRRGLRISMSSSRESTKVGRSSSRVSMNS